MDAATCQDLSRSELLALVGELRAKLAAALARIADLETELAKARKNSRNSSKPPSSDIVKPPPPGPPAGRRHIGAQPGHERHERTPFPPEQIDRHEHHKPSACPDCGGPVQCAAEPALVQQQVEWVAKPYEVVEHRAWGGQCTHCGREVYATLPSEVAQAGLFGPRLTAHVTWLKLRAHVSYSGIQEYLADVCGLSVSRGYLDKVFQRTAAGLRPVWKELLRGLRGQPVLNVDETGHREAGKRRWTWVFRARLFTVFLIATSRGSKVLVRTLGKAFDGILCADYFSAYRKYMGEYNVLVQFCLAHFIRDARFLAELTDPVTRRYGQKVVRRLRHLFRVIHWRERFASPEVFQRALERARDHLRDAVLRAPERREAQNLAERFRKHGDAYLLFVTTPGVDPTNNLAEQALRFVVLDRRVTQGTRTRNGSIARETLWTVAATCRQQGYSLYRYLVDAASAHFAQRLALSLLPAGP
jgi:transposase